MFFDKNFFTTFKKKKILYKIYQLLKKYLEKELHKYFVSNNNIITK